MARRWAQQGTWCRRGQAAAGWLPGLALLLVVLVPSTGQAITVTAIGTKYPTAGADFALPVSVSNTTASTIRWSVDWVSFVGSTCSVSNTANRTDMPLFTAAASSTSTTMTWPARSTAQMLGSHCLIVTACEYFYTPFPPHTGACDDESFPAHVSRADGTLSYPTLYVHEHRQYLAGDNAAMPVPVNMWGTRVVPTTPAADLLELVSCPAGWTCAPPALPAWIALDWGATGGPNLSFQVPDGPPGDWVFRPMLPPLTTEYEFNGDGTGDSAFYANYLRVGSAVNAAISPLADADWFGIYALAGDSIDVWTSDSSTTTTSCAVGIDTYLTLFDPDGSTVLVNNNDSGTNACSRILYTATETGWHYLRATENGNSATIASYYLHLISPDNRSPASFTLHLLDPALVDPARSLTFPSDKRFLEAEGANDSVDTAPSIVGNGVLTGSIDAPGDVDNYGFYAYTATYDSFEVLDLDGTCSQDTVLTLYDKLPSGSLVREHLPAPRRRAGRARPPLHPARRGERGRRGGVRLHAAAPQSPRRPGAGQQRSGHRARADALWQLDAQPRRLHAVGGRGRRAHRGVGERPHRLLHHRHR
jgi:hypothetical protein